MKRIGALVLAACLALPLAACTDHGSPAAGPTAAPTADSTDAEAEHARTLQIYAAVIRQILTKDNAYGGSKARATPYRRVSVVDAPEVVDAAVVAGGSFTSPRRYDARFSAALRTGLRKALGDLAPLHFVSVADATKDLATERLVRDPLGAVVTVGQIVDVGSQVQVSHYLRCGARCGQFMTYVLERRGDSWIVSGTTGVSTIS